MAYRHRDAKFVLNVHGRWDKKTEDERCIAWARAFFRASAPYNLLHQAFDLRLGTSASSADVGTLVALFAFNIVD
jgi:hypothetical protein